MIMRRIVGFIIVVAWISCTSPDKARATLEAAGYSQIEMTGHAWRTCGQDDTCTGFTALGPTGRYVEGAVGCGYGCGGKGCTIRVDP
jgi:hypothetical protein